jgi:hypothetical protein
LRYYTRFGGGSKGEFARHKTGVKGIGRERKESKSKEARFYGII